jgi:hypothetical protein
VLEFEGKRVAPPGGNKKSRPATVTKESAGTKELPAFEAKRRFTAGGNEEKFCCTRLVSARAVVVGPHLLAKSSLSSPRTLPSFIYLSRHYSSSPAAAASILFETYPHTKRTNLPKPKAKLQTDLSRHHHRSLHLSKIEGDALKNYDGDHQFG